METAVTKRKKQEVQAGASEHMVDPAKAFSPDTNIYDTGDALLLVMDMPGVSKGRVALEVDERSNLIVRGENQYIEPNRQVFQQFPVGNYYRAFGLSDELNTEEIEAKIENGVLEIRIPKKEEVKPQRIQISV